MEPWKAILLGLIQGLTEFLPVSSSGHLALAENWLAVPPAERLSLVIAAHLGTLAAVFFAIPARVWRRWMRMPPNDRNRLIVNAVIASAVTGTMFLILSDAVGASFSSLTAVGFGFLGSAIMISIFDGVRKEGSEVEKLRIGGAIVAGVFQGLALFPGLTRSGSVIAGGRAAGLSREEAVFFSFLLAIPAVAGAGVFSLMSPENRLSFSGPVFIVMTTSFAAGIAGGRALVRVAALRSLRFFQYYCICLAAVAFFFAFYRGSDG
jgi:undecaprenyl-diphosphatase